MRGKITAGRLRILKDEDLLTENVTISPQSVEITGPITTDQTFNNEEYKVLTSSTLTEITIEGEASIISNDQSFVEIGLNLATPPPFPSEISAEPEFLNQYSAFDKYGNEILNVKDNIMGGKDSLVNEFDWQGKLVSSEAYHHADGQAKDHNKVVTDLRYDELNRLAYSVETRSFKGASSVQHVPSLTLYNELGRPYYSYIEPAESGISQDANGIYQFSGSELYTIENQVGSRGWQTEIEVRSNNTLFRQNIGYLNSTHSSQGFSSNYNGNISSIKIKQDNGTNDVYYSYNYQYDDINQIKGSSYTAISNAPSGSFDLDDISYDHNGNILSLKRDRGSSTGYMDDLSYSYNGNQLEQVLDIGASGDGQYGFVQNGGSLSTDIHYTYDDNGNLTSDANKQIDLIEYNHLNLPVRYVFSDASEILYSYDASGNKLTRKFKASDQTITKDYRYAGAYVYESNSAGVAPDLAFASTGNGRIKDVNGTHHYEYFIKDHLNNTRINLRKSSLNFTTDFAYSIIQNRHYYPFGLIIEDMSTTPSPNDDNRIAFNGKEIDTDLNLYHYGARFYDPQLGRWSVVDKYDEFHSRYLFVANDPINFTDKDGNGIWGKLVKVGRALYKGGSMAEAFAGNIEDANTLMSDEASTGAKWIAGLSLVSEVLPLSVDDGKSLWKWGKSLFKKSDDSKTLNAVAKKIDDVSPKIQLVNGRKPINSKYAGKTHPSGIKFNEKGFPDFSGQARATVKIDDLTGKYSKDAALANKAAGFSRTPEGFVWHHVEDAKTMQLIPKEVHDSVRHTGGAAVIRAQNKQ